MPVELRQPILVLAASATDVEPASGGSVAAVRSLTQRVARHLQFLEYKTTYRVGNWAEYDRALVRRGDVTLWLTPDAIATWAAAGVGRRSGQLQYSDLAIETALTLSLIFH